MAELPVESAPEAKKSATELSESVKGGDRFSYSEVMSDMRKMEKANPGAAKDFEDKVAGSIDFQTAALYDAKVNFGIIDTNGDARLQPDELKAYAAEGNKDSNQLQKRFVNEHLLKNYHSVANLSSDRVFSYFADDSEIRLKDLTTGIQDKGTVEAFFKKNSDGISLYDRTKAKDGSIDGLEDMLNDTKLAGLTKEQKAAAELLFKKSSNNWFALDEYSKDAFKDKVAGYGINPDTAGTKTAEAPVEKPVNKVEEPPKKIEEPVKKIEEPNKAEQQLKLPPVPEQKIEDKKQPALEKKDKPVENNQAKIEDKKEEVKKEAEAAPSADLIKMATVRDGEGPYQSAQRILKAGGGRASHEEIRALSDALKSVYSGDLNDLHSRHEFINKDNFKKVMENVKNPRVREILKKMSAA